MENSFRYCSLNSNQPLNEDIYLQDQIIRNSQRNYRFSRHPNTNRAYQQYMSTLARVQSALHPRYHPSSTLNIQAAHRRISGGGLCKKSNKSGKEKQTKKKQSSDQQNKTANPSCEAAAPAKKQTVCSTDDEPSCQCNKSASDESPKKHCDSMPEPNKSPCCIGHENQRRSCVSFEEPLAKDIPTVDLHFRDCSCSEPDESCLAAINVCCGQEPHGDSRKPCAGEPPKGTGSRYCMRPMIVVPTGGGTKHVKEHQSKNTKVVSHDHSKSHSAKSQLPDKSNSCKDSSASCCQSGVEIESSCTSHIQELCKGQCKDDFCCFYLSEEPHCSTNPPPCTNCQAICELSKQMEEMNRRLEGLQSQELCDIRSQVNSLNANVRSLANECIQKNECAKTLVEKTSSTCQCCQGQCLHILNSFHRELLDSIRDRCLADLVITLFLRADNIYHVNVRDLSIGCSLACFLVTDAGIEEAMELGVFQEILTFSVIDVRNTIKSKNCALGISFEYHHASRQCGGCDSLLRGTCMAGKEHISRVIGLPLEQLKYVYSIAQSYSKNTGKESRMPSSHLGVELPRIQSHSVSTQTRWKSKSKASSGKAVREMIDMNADEQEMETTNNYTRS